MKRIALLLLFGGLFVFTTSRCFFSPKKFISVLVFSKTQEFRHESIADGKKAFLEMGKKYGFPVDTTEDASFFKEKNTAKIQCCRIS